MGFCCIDECKHCADMYFYIILMIKLLEIAKKCFVVASINIYTHMHTNARQYIHQTRINILFYIIRSTGIFLFYKR